MNDTTPPHKETVIQALREVYDPEIPVNIYDMGLVYRIEVHPPAPQQTGVTVEIDMTLTTANCPMADSIPAMIQSAVRQIPDVNEVMVNMVWDPPWDPSMMSEDAQMTLEMM